MKTLWRLPDCSGLSEDRIQSDIIQPAISAIQEHLLRVELLRSLPGVGFEMDEDGNGSFLAGAVKNDSPIEDDGMYPLKFRIIKTEGGKSFIEFVMPFKMDSDGEGTSCSLNEAYDFPGLVQFLKRLKDGRPAPEFVVTREASLMTVELNPVDPSDYEMSFCQELEPACV